MSNPFEIIDTRLSNIESLLLGLKKSDSFGRSPIETTDRCYFDDALEVTGLSKSKMYKLTASGEIPCKQFGSRLVFSRKELLEWVERKTKPKHDHSEVILAVARAANRKGGRN